MVNFILIAFCVGVGMLLQKLRLVPHDAHKGINTWIMYVALPAVSFKYLPKVQWDVQMIFPVLAPLLAWAGAWVVMELYCKGKHYKQRSRSTLEMVSGFSNTSFIGFPLVTAYYGEGHLPIAILSDQSTFILLSTVGIITSLKASSTERISFTGIAKKLVTFPPFIGCVIALFFSPFVSFEVAEPFFDKLVATVGPLALFSIGLQLKFEGWKQQMPQISMALWYKLILAPGLVLFAALMLNVDAEIAKISIFEMAMPTLVTASIIAEQYHLNTKLVNMTIGISIVLGLFTTALWNQVLIYIFSSL
jgi:predicted permease